jgi:ubiquinone/menaquinone biosynthesis C-methylase UbiE
MSFDPVEFRQESLEGWEAAAPGWTRRSAQIRQWSEPVSHWMVQAIDPQPGQKALELAAGLGETGMLAAELLAPMGSVIISDQTEAMIEAARARAEELGITNVTFQVLNAEWIDLALASLDAVLCRFGYMLMADPGTALSETRRVLRPGGHLALAVWDAIEHNPWALLPNQALADHGHASASATDGKPGPFALSSRERLTEEIEQAGFTEVRIETIELLRRHESFDELWEFQLDVSRSFHDAVLSLPEAQIAAVRNSLQQQMEDFTSADGVLEIPGQTLVAAAEA